MLYLDDFVESVETLPQDMKHYMNDLKDIDTRVKGTVDGFTKEFNKLLAQAANGLEQSSVAKEFGRIARDFNKALEGAEEKIQLAEHCNQIVERQMKRLDIEVNKFQADLEASKPGLTEGLRQQSIAIDEAAAAAAANAPADNKKRKQRPTEQRAQQHEFPQMPQLGQQWGGGSAASSGVGGAIGGYGMGGSVDDAGDGAGAGVGATAHAGEAAVVQQTPEQQHAAGLAAAAAAADPDEPRYCVCHQVSFGEMVGCENEECQHGEWFHYGCVGLTAEPTGTWHCQGCLDEMDTKRRKT